MNLHRNKNRKDKPTPANTQPSDLMASGNQKKPRQRSQKWKPFLKCAWPPRRQR